MSQSKPDFDLIAAEVRAEMARRGQTNSSLAKKLGVSEMWVGRRLRWMARQVDPSDDDLERIAEALGVPADTFLPTKVMAEHRLPVTS